MLLQMVKKEKKLENYFGVLCSQARTTNYLYGPGGKREREESRITPGVLSKPQGGW